jgi:hypothetical protein
MSHSLAIKEALNSRTAGLFPLSPFQMTLLVGIVIVFLWTVSESRANALTEISSTEWLQGSVGRIDFDYALYGYHTHHQQQPAIFYNDWGSASGFCPGGGCALPGGTYFFTDLFDLSPTNEAHIWWDFTGNGSVNLRQIALQGVDDTGKVVEEHYYNISRDYWDISPGHVNLKIAEDTVIWTILFQGRRVTDVPEPSSLLLLATSLALLLGWRRRKQAC